MPFAPHIRVTALGFLGQVAADRFSYGINLRNLGAWAGFAPNAQGWQDLADDVAAFHARLDSRISAMAVLDTVKIAHIGADGKYTEDPRQYAYNQPGAYGAAPTQQLLPQSALAVSLVTDRRGPSGKGRFYLPIPSVETDQNNGWKIPVAQAEGVRNSVVTLLNDMANQPGLDLINLKPVVASTKGYNTDVTGVRVGRIVDTIRSRRNALVESYTAVAVTTP